MAIESDEQQILAMHEAGDKALLHRVTTHVKDDWRRTAASELSNDQRSILMPLSFRATSFSASKVSGDCENDISAS